MEQLIVLTIMPGITELVPDVYIEALVQWLESRSDADAPPAGILAIATKQESVTEPIGTDEEHFGGEGSPIVSTESPGGEDSASA